VLFKEAGTMNHDEASIPLDRTDLEQASLGDASFEKELLVEFLDGSGNLIASLNQALATSDVQQMRRAAHSLKGCCWTIGARPMGRVCEKLEIDARDGRLEEAELLIDRIREHLSQVEVYVRRHWAL